MSTEVPSNWKLLFLKILGGRPMTDDGFYFTNEISGTSVHKYTDKLGRKWMSDRGPWALYRVRLKEKEPGEEE